MDLTDLQQLGPIPVLGLVLYLLGMGLKKSPLADWMIPIILIGLGAAVYPFIAEVGKVSYQCRNPEVFNSMIGAAVGGLSIGAHQVFKQFAGRNDDPPKPPTDNKPQPPST